MLYVLTRKRSGGVGGGVKLDYASAYIIKEGGYRVQSEDEAMSHYFCFSHRGVHAACLPHL